jgi:hypothetical protein
MMVFVISGVEPSGGIATMQFSLCGFQGMGAGGLSYLSFALLAVDSPGSPFLCGHKALSRGTAMQAVSTVIASWTWQQFPSWRFHEQYAAIKLFSAFLRDGAYIGCTGC